VLAASVVLAVAICWTQFAGGNRAYAAVAGALETASRLQDRTYRILALVRGPLGRDKEVESSVAVRGGRAFALRHPSLLFNGEVWFGRRENEFWFVPTVGPVIASEDPAWSRDVLSEMQISTPYLQVTSVLAPMKDLYRLEDLPSEELPTVAGGAERQFFRRVRGTLLDDDSRLPQSIDLWLEPRTKLARRLLLVWEAGTGPAGIQQVTFDLASTDPLPDNWYEHSSHHDASRIVIHKP
jgi:hypothetical protein